MAGTALTTSVPTDARLRELAAFEGRGAPVLSVYLDADGRRYPRKQQIEHLAEEMLDKLVARDMSREWRVALADDAARVLDFVRGLERKGVRGVAAFACGAHGLFDAFSLPVSVRSRVTVDSHPHVLRLESVMEHAERFVAALVSRDKARLVSFRLGMTEEIVEIAGEVPRRHSQGGWSQANYERHVDELAHRHLRSVADALFAHSRKQSFDHLVLGGTDGVVAEFEKLLHPWLRDRIAQRVSVAVAAPVAEIAEALAGAEEAVEHERAAASVSRILDEFAGSRNAVVGLPAVLGALLDNRVEVLALSDGEERGGFRCTSCRRLAVADGGCPSCGETMGPVADLHEEMVDEALRHGARVVTSQTHPLPDAVGALLRF